MKESIGISEVDTIKIVSDFKPEKCSDFVVTEHPVTITIDDVGSYTIMCTPSDLMPFAIGFAYSEGLIESMHDVDLLRCCDDDPSSIRMKLRKLPANHLARNLIITSSCGLCGNADIQQVIENLRISEDTLKVTMLNLTEIQKEMKSLQVIFKQTGGTHAAAIFSSQGNIIAFAEDVGRHSALDKAIGMCLLSELSTNGCGVALSGRVSLEMVAKSARAGLEIIAAVSAPSSLAVDAAKRCGITLCGFVRDDKATVYSHEQRICFSELL